MEKNILKEISKSNNRDIVLKMDESVHWSDYIKEINKLKDDDLFLEKCLSQLPKTSKGQRCYLSYKNRIYAWLEIYSITKKVNNTTIQMYPYLNFVFPSLDNMDFIEEFRYFYDNSNYQ